jgi:hypothetical protein
MSCAPLRRLQQCETFRLQWRRPSQSLVSPGRVAAGRELGRRSMRLARMLLELFLVRIDILLSIDQFIFGIE